MEISLIINLLRAFLKLLTLFIHYNAPPSEQFFINLQKENTGQSELIKLTISKNTMIKGFI